MILVKLELVKLEIYCSLCNKKPLQAALYKLRQYISDFKMCFQMGFLNTSVP